MVESSCVVRPPVSRVGTGGGWGKNIGRPKGLRVGSSSQVRRPIDLEAWILRSTGLIAPQEVRVLGWA